MGVTDGFMFKMGMLLAEALWIGGVVIGVLILAIIVIWWVEK